MRRFILALALALALPVAATADEAPPPPVTTTGTVVVVVGTPTAPSNIVAPPAPAVDEDPCSVHRSGRWKRLRGRVSLGFSRSHLALEDDGEATQTSFVARLHGRPGWSLELELAKAEVDGGAHTRSVGASAVKAFGQRRIAPYLIAGGGAGRYEEADVARRMHFGEVGAGLVLRGRRFSVGVDLRRGVRKVEEAETDVMRAVEPTADDDDRTHYTRGRVLALINF